MMMLMLIRCISLSHTHLLLPPLYHTDNRLVRRSSSSSSVCPPDIQMTGGGDGGGEVGWETSKENIMPLARGRNVDKLDAVLKER